VFARHDLSSRKSPRGNLEGRKAEVFDHVETLGG
jgi:hypothetical protein